MNDPGTRAADQAVVEMERRFRAIYREAQKDIVDKLNDWLKKYKRLDAEKRKQVEAGKITKEQYQNWVNGQIFRQKQWQDKMTSVATSLLYANQQANDIVEGKKKAVFGENATYQAYKLEKDAGMDLSFSVYDEATVTRLIKDQPELLPRKVVNGVKDKAWNRKIIANCVTQGIIQGESIPDIAQRIARDTCSTNMKAMTRYARTAITGAENAGKMEMLHEAQGMGINVKKKWLATLDSRTRDAHQALDGQVQDVDKPFQSELGPIMFPGDPTAHPGNVWNCRCTMIYIYPEYMPKNAQRGAYKEYEDENGEKRREYETIPDMTYKEWKNWKSSSIAAVQTQKKDFTAYTQKLNTVLSPTEYLEAKDLIEKSPAQKLYENYADSCSAIVKQSGGGVYRAASDTVIFGIESRQGQSPYSTMAHEMAHMFDAKIGKTPTLNFSEIDLINSKCVIGNGLFKTIKEVPSASDQFLSAMRKDKKGLQVLLANNAELANMKTGALRNASAGIQDAMDGFFDTQKRGILPWGHGSTYYNRAYNRKIVGYGNQKNLQDAFKQLGFDASNLTKTKRLMRDYETASELWANCVSAVTCGGEELAAFEKYMPETVQAVKNIIGGL